MYIFLCWDSGICIFMLHYSCLFIRNVSVNCSVCCEYSATGRRGCWHVYISISLHVLYPTVFCILVINIVRLPMMLESNWHNKLHHSGLLHHCVSKCDRSVDHRSVLKLLSPLTFAIAIAIGHQGNMHKIIWSMGMNAYQPLECLIY